MLKKRGVNTFHFDQKYSEFIENLSEGIWIIDENANTTFVNSAMADMLGYEPKEMIGKHLFDFMDEDAVLSAKNYLGRRSSGIKETHYFEFTHKSGHKVFTHIKTYPLLDNYGKYYGALAAITNLTEQRKSEEIKKAAENKFNTIFEFFLVGLGIIDKDWTIINVNKKLTKLLNCIKDEMLNKSFLSLIDEEYHPDLITKLKQLNNHDLKNYFGEYKITFKDKIIEKALINIFPIVTISDKQPEFLFSITDANEEENYHYELIKNEALFRSVLEHSTAAITIWDSKLKNIFANQNAVNLFGRKLNPIFKGEPLEEVMRRYELPEFYPKWANRIKEGFNNVEIRYYEDEALVDGHSIYSETTIIPIKNESGQVFAVDVLFRDVTKSKKLENELIEKEKLASVGRMAAHISHEIRSPLALISINLELLKQGLALNEKKLKSLSIIETELARLNSLLNDILKFSVEFSLYKSLFYINEMLDYIGQLMKATCNERNVTYINLVKPIQIFGDRSKIEGAFINLIMNSLEAINNDGKIEIYSSNQNEDKFVNIFIKDSGCGIEEPEKIFQTFFSTKKNGTGLGLPIVKNILEKHGGSIKLLSSKPGETIFMIKFPKNDKE